MLFAANARKEFTAKNLTEAGYKEKNTFCVLGNGWWRLLKILYWVGPYQLLLYPILYPVIWLAYQREWETGHKLFSVAEKE